MKHAPIILLLAALSALLSAGNVALDISRILAKHAAASYPAEKRAHPTRQPIQPAAFRHAGRCVQHPFFKRARIEKHRQKRRVRPLCRYLPSKRQTAFAHAG